VSGTPTFFINGRRHYGVYDIDTLTEEVGAAKTRARQLAAAAQAARVGAQPDGTGVPTDGTGAAAQPDGTGVPTDSTEAET
jgi:hypothetical protein